MQIPRQHRKRCHRWQEGQQREKGHFSLRYSEKKYVSHGGEVEHAAFEVGWFERGRISNCDHGATELDFSILVSVAKSITLNPPAAVPFAKRGRTAEDLSGAAGAMGEGEAGDRSFHIAI